MVWSIRKPSSDASSRTLPRRTISSRPSEWAYPPTGKSGSAVCRRNGSHSPTSMVVVLAMTVTMSRPQRREDLLHGVELQVLALADLTHRRVIDDAHRLRRDLNREVQISKQPAETSSLRGGFSK